MGIDDCVAIAPQRAAEPAVAFGRFSKTSLATGVAEKAFGQPVLKASWVMTSPASAWVRPLSMAFYAREFEKEGRELGCMSKANSEVARKNLDGGISGFCA